MVKENVYDDLVGSRKESHPNIHQGLLERNGADRVTSVHIPACIPFHAFLDCFPPYWFSLSNPSDLALRHESFVGYWISGRKHTVLLYVLQGCTAKSFKLSDF